MLSTLLHFCWGTHARVPRPPALVGALICICCGKAQPAGDICYRGRAHYTVPNIVLFYRSLWTCPFGRDPLVVLESETGQQRAGVQFSFPISFIIVPNIWSWKTSFQTGWTVHFFVFFGNPGYGLTIVKSITIIPFLTSVPSLANWSFKSLTPPPPLTVQKPHAREQPRWYEDRGSHEVCSRRSLLATLHSAMTTDFGRRWWLVVDDPKKLKKRRKAVGSPFVESISHDPYISRSLPPSVSWV